MIKVYKNTIAPTALEKGYIQDEISKQILSDQHDKCYLCERHVSTDYEIEHLVPKSVEPTLLNEWSNLFIACAYCNKHKSNTYSGILNPWQNDIEDIIDQKFNTDTPKAEFTSLQQDDSVCQTISLLDKLYNGKNGLRKTREQRFFNEAYYKFSNFMNDVGTYLSSHQDSDKQKVIADLAIEEELLGFKYSYINSNPKLREEFGAYIKWNK